MQIDARKRLGLLSIERLTMAQRVKNLRGHELIDNIPPGRGDLHSVRALSGLYRTCVYNNSGRCTYL